MLFRRLLLAAALLTGLCAPAHAALKVVPLACESTSDTTSPLDLAGAVTGYLGFGAAGLSSGDTAYYQLTNGSNHEEGVGTYTTGSPNTWTRDPSPNSTAGLATPLTLSGNSTICIGVTSGMFTSPRLFGNLLPTVNDGATLGSASFQISDLFLAEGGVINWDNGDATLTQTADDITFAGISTFGVGTSTVVTLGSIELANTDTTITRTGSGEAAIEGDAIKHAGKETIWIPATAMMPNETNGCTQNGTETTTNLVMLTSCDYNTSTQQAAQFTIAMPKAWNEGTVTFMATWYHPSTSTNFGVAWDVACLYRADAAAGDTAFGTVQTVTDTGGTTNAIYTSAESSAITCAGSPAEGGITFFRVRRAPANGSDNLAVDARLLGIKVFWTSNAASDD